MNDLLAARSAVEDGDFRHMLDGIELVPITPVEQNQKPGSNQGTFRTPERSPTLTDLSGQVKRQGSYPAAHGGFADIWICDWELETGEGRVSHKVAVKVLRCPSDHEEERTKLNKRLRRELRVWAGLKHPQVLPLFGVASDFGPYLSMVCPWKDNGNLNRYLEGPGHGISLADRFRILHQVATGLAYLHSFSVVHGDLTGANVLIDGAGDACLSDFGLSTVMLDIQGASNYTSSIGGNVRFAAPENYRLDENADNYVPTITKYSDVYSFGSIMLQTLSGRIPYHYMRSDAQVLIELVRGTWPRRPTDSEYVTDGRWAFMSRCWAYEPLKRPSLSEIITYCEREPKAGPEETIDANTLALPYGTFRPESMVNISRDGLLETWVGTWHKTPIETVSMKIVHIKMNRSRKKDFVSGLRKYGEISHKNLLPLLAIAPDIGRFAGVVTPWVEGSMNLNTFLRKNDLEMLHKHRLLLEVGEGLRYLHSQQLVHGTFTGWSILITKDNELRINNAGIIPAMISLLDETPDIEVYSEDIRWTDPGVWNIRESLPTFTPSVDVYAFGSVMLQVFSGYIPYSNMGIAGVPRVVERRFQDMTRFRLGKKVISDEEWGLILECWSPDRTIRPTMDNVMSRLRTMWSRSPMY